MCSFGTVSRYISQSEACSTALVSTCVSKVEIFVGELFSVYAHPASTVSLDKVAPLQHEVLDHAVERRSLVTRRYALCKQMPKRDNNKNNKYLLWNFLRLPVVAKRTRGFMPLTRRRATYVCAMYYGVILQPNTSNEAQEGIWVCASSRKSIVKPFRSV